MSENQKQVAVSFRMGKPDDAEHIARYYNSANNGLSEIWWTSQAKDGESWIEAFKRDIHTPNSIAYFERVVVAEADGQAVGILIAFPQEAIPPKEHLQELSSAETNIVELRRLVEGSMFIAIVAIDKKYRGLGIARHFINLSMQVAETSALKEASIIIHESNKAWLESFLRRGFRERAQLDVGHHAFYPHDSDWILLTRPVPSAEQEQAS